MNHGNTEAVDVICGGFPCVDLSFAGKGAGLEGARSGLWFEYLRLVRELRPRYVVIENVAALLVRGLDVVLGGLAEAGYDAVWFTLRAADVGAPHLRERLFIVGYANGARLEGRGVRGRGRSDERAVGETGSEMADAASERRREGRSEFERWERVAAPIECGSSMFGLTHEFPPSPGDHDGWRDYLARFPNRAPAVPNAKGSPSLNPVFVEALQGFPEGWTEGTRSQRLKQLGNAVVPQCAEVVGHVLLGIKGA